MSRVPGFFRTRPPLSGLAALLGGASVLLAAGEVSSQGDLCRFPAVSSAVPLDTAVDPPRSMISYRAPYAFRVPDVSSLVPTSVVAIAIAAGDQDHVYAWYDDGSVSSGTSWNLQAYRLPYPYALPERATPPQTGEAPRRYTPRDIVAIDIAPDNRVHAWYDDGHYSVGTSWDLASRQPPAPYSVPGGRSAADIVGIAIGPDGMVHSWYRDGTSAVGTVGDLGAHGASSFTPPPGATADDILGMGIAGDGHVYTWYTTAGTDTADLVAHDWCFEIDEPVGMGREIQVIFQPRLRNASQRGLCSDQEGVIAVSGSWPEVRSDTSPLRPFAHWMIGPGEIQTRPGLAMPFHPDNTYSFKWSVTHPADSDPSNNGINITVRGAQLQRDPDFAHRRCRVAESVPW